MNISTILVVAIAAFAIVHTVRKYDPAKVEPQKAKPVAAVAAPAAPVPASATPTPRPGAWMTERNTMLDQKPANTSKRAMNEKDGFSRLNRNVRVH